MSIHRTTTRRRSARRRLAVPLAASLLGLATWAAAAPVNITYLKDARATSTAPNGTATPNIFFSTPVAGLNQATYTQGVETVTAVEDPIWVGSGSTTTAYDASIAAGTLKAKSTSTTSGMYHSAIGTGLSTSADQVLGITDTLRVNGGAAGSTVHVNFSLMLNSLLSFLNVPTGANAALCGYGSVSLFADVGATRVSTLSRDLCNGSDAMTGTGTFDVISGQDFDLHLGMEILSQAAIGAGNIFGSSVSIDADHTGLLYLLAPANYTLTSTSGYSYLDPNGGGGNNGGGGVPEPTTLALLSMALLGWVSTRRKV